MIYGFCGKESNWGINWDESTALKVKVLSSILISGGILTLLLTNLIASRKIQPIVGNLIGSASLIAGVMLPICSWKNESEGLNKQIRVMQKKVELQEAAICILEEQQMGILYAQALILIDRLNEYKEEVQKLQHSAISISQKIELEDLSQRISLACRKLGKY